MFIRVNYFVINVSSPNTPNLRDLQEKKPLELIIRNINLFNGLFPESVIWVTTSILDPWNYILWRLDSI